MSSPRGASAPPAPPADDNPAPGGAARAWPRFRVYADESSGRREVYFPCEACGLVEIVDEETREIVDEETRLCRPCFRVQAFVAFLLKGDD